MLYAIVAVLIVILDQASKLWVSYNIAFGEGIKELIPGVVSLVNVHNTGAAFGFLSGEKAKIFLIGICVVLVVFVIVALATNLISGSLGRWSAVCIMAGGIGNCIDRIINGYVQDMIKTEFINFYIFNVADMFIVVFGILFILYVIFGGKEKNRADYDDDDDDDDDDDEDEDDELPPVRRRRAEKPVDMAAAEPVRKALPLSCPALPGVDMAAAEPVRKAAEPLPDRLEPAVRRAKPAADAGKYEAEYDRFIANRNARTRNESPAAKGEGDPFADWDKANKAAAAEKKPAEPVKAPEAPKAEPTPAPKSDFDFSLDDILNEFTK